MKVLKINQSILFVNGMKCEEVKTEWMVKIEAKEEEGK